jgi:hypothetical protein
MAQIKISRDSDGRWTVSAKSHVGRHQFYSGRRGPVHRDFLRDAALEVAEEMAQATDVVREAMGRRRIQTMGGQDGDE